MNSETPFASLKSKALLPRKIAGTLPKTGNLAPTRFAGNFCEVRDSHLQELANRAKSARPAVADGGLCTTAQLDGRAELVSKRQRGPIAGRQERAQPAMPVRATNEKKATRIFCDEAALIERVCGGDRELFYELVHPHERLVYATAASVMKNGADAEEVAQEAILKAFANLGAFRREAKFSTWLVQITYNEARMRLRKSRPHLYDSLECEVENEKGEYRPRDFADWRPIPLEILERQEARRAVHQAIDSLSPPLREVLVLRDIQNLSTRETMEILGIPVATVKSRLYRARLQLRDTLAPGFGGRWLRGNGRKKLRPR